MTPPINEVPSNSEGQTKNSTSDETADKKKVLFDTLNTGKKVGRFDGLVNKPNMTERDKRTMRVIENMLIGQQMDTPKNIKMLEEKISYTTEYIKVGPIKRDRKNLEAQPNEKTIFLSNGMSYFVRSSSMITQQNKLLKQRNMEIPSDSHYEKSLQALPGGYENTGVAGRMLAHILDMPRTGYFEIDLLESIGEDGSGNYWTASPKKDNKYYAGRFRFTATEGGLGSECIQGKALPIRTIFK